MMSGKFQYSLAVVIGIDDYRNGVPSLKTPVNDAQTLAAILQDRHGYDVKLLLNEAANCTALKDLLGTELPKQLSKDDRLLFYFAGHGIALNGDDGPEGYLIPSDARLGDISTYVSMATVNQALLKLPCRHFLGILDCCFAGAFRWSSTRKLVPIELGTLHKERYDRFIRDPAWQVITSAASDQFAQDAFDLKSTQRGLQGNHSPFAAALIEALEGSADAYPPAQAGKPAGDGVITATELYLYLRDRVEPDAETRAMRQTPGIFPLTRHDKGEFIFLSPGHPLNLPPAPPLDESSNPYRGLESFDEVHKDLFFGRQALTHTLAEFVTNHPLTVVLGASGSGKSSLVKAGLIPKLQQGNDWICLSPFRPGESPFKALNQVLQAITLPETTLTANATALGLLTPVQSLSVWFEAHPQAHLLVVVDQLEELITLCGDQQERKNFLEVLGEAIATRPTQLHLVLTLRSDFEPQFRNTALETDWQGARFVVPAMTRDELRQAIEAPASARVMVFDPHELVDQLIDEVANMPGALPLLSFALSELYLNYLKRQDDARKRGETLDRAMTQADYEAMGGVTRSLTQRAERVYKERVEIDPAYEHTIRNVMLRMVSIGGEMARRRVPEVELVYPDAAENGRVKEAITRFEDARLLTSDTDPDDKDKTYKEPAHDALVRGWPRLLDWKQEHLRELLLQGDLTADANQWERSGKKKQDSGLLWIEDPRLPTALQLSCGKDYKDNWLNLFRWRFGYQTWQSQTPEHWLNTSEMDFVRQSFDQKFKRFRNTTIIVAGVILTLSGLTGFATQSAQEANRQKDEATKQAGIALNNQKKAEANQKEASARNLVAQAELAQTQQPHLLPRSLLLAVSAYQDSPKAVEVEVSRVLSHGLSLLATPIKSSSPKEFLGTAKKAPSSLNNLRNRSSSNRQLVNSINDFIESIQSERERYRTELLTQSKDGRFIVTDSNGSGASFTQGFVDHIISIWDVRQRREVSRLLYDIHDYIESVQFTDDQSHIIVNSGNNTKNNTTVYELTSLQKQIYLTTNQSRPHVLTDSKNTIGTRLDETGKFVRITENHNGILAIDPVYQAHLDAEATSISPDGKHIAFFDSEKSVLEVVSSLSGAKYQSITIQNLVEPLQTLGSRPPRITFSPDGRYIAFSAFKNYMGGGVTTTTKIWEVLTKKLVGQTPWQQGIFPTQISLSPNGRLLVTVLQAVGYSSPFVSVTDISTSRELPEISGKIRHDALISGINFSFDGKYLATASDKAVRIWNIFTGEQVVQILYPAQVKKVYFSRDGKEVIAITTDRIARIQTWQTLDLVTEVCERLNRNLTWGRMANILYQ
jgi:WD40 repeat protein